ncbi:hypothetical protein FDUTEX481_07336 [Tolypothrix sp. PCC 7601]|nr:hypothetical protein FDUTEX481_07336 [Tolypothrix sp. PCC 7601]
MRKEWKIRYRGGKFPIGITQRSFCSIASGGCTLGKSPTLLVTTEEGDRTGDAPKCKSHCFVLAELRRVKM